MTSRGHQKQDQHNEEYTIKPAEGLPEGWIWHDWNDGSGSLESPTGESLFSYDRVTSEYRFKDERWEFFPGYPYETCDLSEVKEIAINRIKWPCLKNKSEE